MASDLPRDALGRALDVLERFLDEELNSFDRALALNDASVPDAVVVGFLRVLDPAVRLEALARCWRPAVLAEWAAVAKGNELRAIARNCWTPSSTFRELLDGADEEMRYDIAHGCVEDPELVAWLLADVSQRVRSAMRAALTNYRAANEQVRDQFPAEAPMDWLHEAVPAAEAEDLLKAHASEQLAQKFRDVYDEPPAPPYEEVPSAEEPEPELDEAVAVLQIVFGADRVF